MMAKIQKKIKSKQLMIELENKNIKFSNEPQNILGILNYGLSNGIKTDVIIQKVSEIACLADMILPPNKSYCFLKFPSLEDAQQVMNKFNGEKMFEENGFPVLFSYCKSIPPFQEDSCEEPKGLIVLLDFITDEIEKKLLSLLEWDESKMKNRQVQHFGYEFIYGTNTVDHNKPLDRKIPTECDELWNILDEKCPQFKGFRPDQLTVNKYEPGHGIPSHCDTHSVFEELIISLSLNASIVMEFKNGQNHFSKLLPRKSLLIMSDESRYGWTHGIVPKTSDVVKTKHGFLTVQQRELRYSFTFRKLRVPPHCDCNFPSLCDMQTKIAQNAINECKVDDKIAAKLELENVHNVYNEIGNHFSETRHSPWPNVENFISSLKEGSILLDVGCGNGKYLNINDKIIKFGCDRSETLLQVCYERNFQVFQCDCLQLPFPDESVDACISIAVIHHLATHERRVQAIKEILRVLRKDNGKALIYVWAKDQQKDNKKSTYLLQHQNKSKEDENKLPEIATLNIDEEEIKLPIHRNRTQFNHTNNGNLLVPWKLKKKEVAEDQQKVYLRYYHVFEDGELETLCKACGNVEIIKSFYDQGNHCVVLKKLNKL